MTSFNVSILPIYSFFILSELITFANCTKKKKISNTSELPLSQNTDQAVLPQLTAISWHHFHLQLPSYLVGCWKGKGRIQVLQPNPQPFGRTFACLFLLILICKSRYIGVCINWFIACLSWKTLHIFEYAKNTSFLKSFASSSGVSSFPPESYLLAVLWPAMPCVWIHPNISRAVPGLGWFRYWRGKIMLPQSLMLEWASWLLKKTLPFLTIFCAIHSSLASNWTTARACTSDLQE